MSANRRLILKIGSVLKKHSKNIVYGMSSSMDLLFNIEGMTFLEVALNFTTSVGFSNSVIICLIAKYVPRYGRRVIIGKALLLKRFLMKQVTRKIRREPVMRRNIGGNTLFRLHPCAQKASKP